ncbi:hypothetical protein, partial [Klebsiella pneumoniae]|uniref:hypothetical protein n=1 Tax=Klebsiella pneumoniae TaxID=573 RepID=UPI00202F10C3
MSLLWGGVTVLAAMLIAGQVASVVFLVKGGGPGGGMQLFHLCLIISCSCPTVQASKLCLGWLWG